MSLPPSLYSRTSASKRLPSHTSHGAATPAIIAEVGVDHAGTVAVGAGALGVGAEQGGLHAVGLGERLADRVEQARVGRRVAPPRPLDRRLVDRHHAVAALDRPVGSASSCPIRPRRSARRARRAGCRRRRRCRLLVSAPRISNAPVGVRTSSLSVARSSRWRPVSVPLVRSSSTVPSNTTSPPAAPAPGPRSTTWSPIAIVSGLCSTTSTVLPLSRSCRSSSFMRSMSCGCEPDGRLVEHVGDVGERRAEVADHLGALRLAARQRARRPFERAGSRARCRRTSRASRPATSAAAPPTARRVRSPTRRGR